MCAFRSAFQSFGGLDIVDSIFSDSVCSVYEYLMNGRAGRVVWSQQHQHHPLYMQVLSLPSGSGAENLHSCSDAHGNCCSLLQRTQMKSTVSKSRTLLTVTTTIM